MDPSLESIFAGVIVVVLLCLAGYFGRRQLQTLRGMGTHENDPPEYRDYFRKQAWLRLTSCGLMVVFAALLAATYVGGQERHARELGEMRQANLELNAEQQRAAKVWIAYWLVMMFILTLIVILAVFDLFSIRRFGLKHYRKIQDDRRTMIERQVAILRRQRNGHEG